jgi:hypothetical protein
LFAVFEETPNVSQFVPGKAATTFEAHRIEPELGLVAVAANVHVGRFAEAVRRVEMYAVRAFAESGRHEVSGAFFLLSGASCFRTIRLECLMRPPAGLFDLIFCEGIVNSHQSLRAHFYLRQVAPIKRVVDGLPRTTSAAGCFVSSDDVRFFDRRFF